MAIIYSYPNVTPLGEDFLIGSQKSNSNATKNFTVDAVVQAGVGYTVYTALISQSATNAPTATVLKNNTGHTYTWARTSTGEYTITASGNAFTNNKTLICLMGQRAFNIPLSFRRDSDTVISLFSGNSSGTSTDGVIADLSFEIRIYS